MAQARPPCPKVVAIPAGWRRAYPKEITPTVQRAAVTALRQALPIAKLQVTDVNGRMFGFLTEWHYDDHCTKPGQPIWHPGISTIVAIKEPPKVNPAAVQQLIASTMTYDPSDSSYSTVAGEEDESHLDAVMGADFGEEHNDDESDFGAVMTGRVKAKGSVNVSAQLKAKAAAAAKAKATANARAQSAARARAAQAKAKPTPSAARTTPTRTDSPTGPATRAPVTPRATGYIAPTAAFAPEAPQADEAQFDNYEMPSEETPETADEGSESYDESAIGAEFNISG
jgi:hypothetical protein